MAVGKNFSMNSKASERDKRDMYPTPPCLTTTFLNEYSIGSEDDTIWECACGNMDMANILKKRFKNVIATDKYGEGNEKCDFLLDTAPQVTDFIMTNPPYRYALEFILRAKEVAEKGFAFLLPLSYLHGKERFDKIWMDKEYPLAHVYVFNRYPMLGIALRDDGLIETGMMAMAWYIWKKDHVHPPQIHWLDIDKYILRKRKEKV